MVLQDLPLFGLSLRAFYNTPPGNVLSVGRFIERAQFGYELSEGKKAATVGATPLRLPCLVTYYSKAARDRAGRSYTAER